MTYVKLHVVSPQQLKFCFPSPTLSSANGEFLSIRVSYYLSVYAPVSLWMSNNLLADVQDTVEGGVDSKTKAPSFIVEKSTGAYGVHDTFRHG